MHKPRTGVYIFVIEGEINVAGENLSRRDGIGIWDIESVTIEAISETQILAIEVAM
jgi:redox-sensitive bicupin YhaK (pirin superfamily)